MYHLIQFRKMFNLKIKQNLKYTHRQNIKPLIFKQVLDIPTRVH